VLAVSAAADRFSTIINDRIRLDIQGDFGVSATMATEGSGFGGFSLYGSLALPRGEPSWHARRVDLGLRGGSVALNLWDSTSSTAAIGRTYAVGEPVRKLELRRAGEEILVLANDAQIGILDASGFFAGGVAFVGLNVGPGVRLLMHSLAVETALGDEANVRRAPLDVTIPRSAGSLASAAASRDRLVGVGENERFLFRSPRGLELAAREFNAITMGNALKMGPVHPRRGLYAFCDADQIVAFASLNDMKVRGHTLVWHQQQPSWVIDGGFSRDELMAVLREHIQTVVGRYRGRIAFWDAVNEAIAPDGSLRDTLWLRGIGPEYIELAFRWAAEADPEARLFYNEFGAEGRGAKSDAVYRFAADLKQRGVPIHGVGMQAHLTQAGVSPEAVAENMARLGALGLDVHITELDVRLEPPITEALLARQAQIYGDMTRVCLSAPNCKALVFWNLHDGDSWIPDAFPGRGWAHLFDEAFRPKPAYTAVMDQLRGR